MQRLLPLQPGITQPYGVFATTDATYPIESTMTSSSVEYKSILTEENLSRMNHLSEDANTKSHTTATDINSSNKSAQSIEYNSNTSEQTKCDNGIDNCDTIDSGDNQPEYTTSNSDMDSDEEENNRIRQRLDADPGIQSLMEISLPSPIPLVHSADECKHKTTLTTTFLGIYFMVMNLPLFFISLFGQC